MIHPRGIHRAILCVLLGLLALALGTPARAAVMTWNVGVTFNGNGYDISYNLLTDVTDMTVQIFKSTAPAVVVKTLDVNSTPAITSAQLTAGAHSVANSNQVTWNGDLDSGGNAPAGQYFAVIKTTGAPVAAMAGLVAATNQTTYTDGRFGYNGSACLDATSVYHNTIYWPNKASTSGSAIQREGVGFWKPNLTTSMLDASSFATKTADGTPVGNINATGSGTSNAVSVLSDGNIVVSSGSTVQGGKFIVLKPSATNAGTPATNTTGTTFGTGIYTRAMRAFGTSAAPRIFYINDSASTTFTSGATGINYVDYTTAGATPTTIIPSTSFPVTERSLAVNRANDTIWVGGSSLVAGTVTVQRWTRTGALPGTWTKSAFGSFAIPSQLTAAGSVAWVELSPDESTLWVAIGGGSVNSPPTTITAVAGQDILMGVDPTTGAPISSQLLTGNSVLRDWPEQIVQTGTYDPSTGTYYNGNLVVPSYGSLTQTTGRGLQVIAPADNGSTDIMRGPDFSVVQATKVTLLTGPTVAVTYHGATIAWTTDIQSDSVVDFGTTPGSYTGNVTISDPTTSHSVVVDNLEKNTLYYYRVTSNAGSLTPAQSTEKTFTTTPLNVSAVTATRTESGVTVAWTTNESATTLLHYGVSSGSLDKSVLSTTLSTSHSATVAGYKPGTVLYYQPESGYYLASPGSSTPPTPTLGVQANVTVPASALYSNIRINAGADTATITFDTNIATTATMVWGITTSPATTVADTGTATAHVFTVTGLTPGTTYYYIPTLAPADGSLAARALPVATFITTVLGGSPMTATNAAPADVALSSRVNLEAPVAGSLFKLAKQGIPGAPVAGPDLPAARHHEGVVVHNGYMYVIGGRSAGGTYYGNVWINKIDADGVLGGDPGGTLPWITGGTSANSFSGGPNDLPAPRAQINNMCFGYNGYIYVVGGVDASVITINTVWYAKQNADGTLSLPPGATAVTAGLPWAATTALPTNKSLGSARVVDGYVLVSGGTISPNSAVNYMARIKPDGSLGTWLTSRPINDTHTYQRTVVNNHTVYSVGGQNNPGTTLVNTEDISTAQPDRELTPWYRLTYDPAYSSAVMDNPGDTEDNSGHWGMACDLVRGKILSVAGRLNTDPSNRNNPAMLSQVIAYTKLDASGMPGAWVDASVADPSVVYPAAVIDLDGQAWNGSIYTAGGRITTALGAQVTTEQIPMVDDGANFVYSGTAESQMIDLGSVTNLKHFTVTGTNVSSSTVEARYRYANSEGNFTDWLTPSSLDADISGGARWFQYELVLKGDGSGSPVVTNVTVTAGSFGTLAFTTQPAGAVPAVAFATQPVVAVQDNSGVTIAGYTGPVTVAIKAGTGTPGAVLSGTLTVNAVAGVATFTDLAIDQAGTGYVLTATASGLSVDSAAFNVGVVPFTLADVIQALRRAGGLDVASGPDMGRLNVVTSGATQVIDVRDAVLLARKVRGRDSNP